MSDIANRTMLWFEIGQLVEFDTPYKVIKVDRRRGIVSLRAVGAGERAEMELYVYGRVLDV